MLASAIMNPSADYASDELDDNHPKRSERPTVLEGAPSTETEAYDTYHQLGNSNRAILQDYGCCYKPTTMSPRASEPAKNPCYVYTSEGLSHDKDSPSFHNQDAAMLLLQQRSGSMSNATASPPFTDSNTPPYLRWAENLRNLLEDPEGVQLFLRYLKSEGCQDSLEFWLACQGLKSKPKENDDEIKTLIRLIHRKIIRPSTNLAISNELRQTLNENIQAGKNLDQHIFDLAQSQVETATNATTYPSFLQSDIYLQFMREAQSGGQDSVDSSCGSESSRGSVDESQPPKLATVNENEELQMETGRPGSLPLTLHHLQLTQRRRNTYREPLRKIEGGPNGNILNPYHCLYAPCVPVSAQDSELQSLSSDAHTDETKSLTDSSVDGGPIYSNKKYLRRQNHTMRQHVRQNRECNDVFIPRTMRIPKACAPQDPEVFAGLLIQRLELVEQERDKDDKLEKQINISQGMEGVKATDEFPDPPKCFTFLPSGLLKLNVAEDNSQAILDDHVNRVFMDCSTHQMHSWTSTPERRARAAVVNPSVTSPGYSRMASTGGSSSAHHRHRRDRDAVSMFSSDSGLAMDYVDQSNAQVPFASQPYHVLGNGGSSVQHHNKHNHHHHHHAGKVKASAQKLPPEFAEHPARGYGGLHPEAYAEEFAVEQQDRRKKHHVLIQEPYAEEFAPERDHRGKEHSRRSVGRKTTAAAAAENSVYSCGDSGVCTSHEPTPTFPPSINSHERVTLWMLGNEKYSGSNQADSEKESSTKHRRSSHSSSLSAGSPIPNRPGRVKKPVAYNTSRSGSLERGGPFGGNRWPTPSQPIIQDPSMPVLPPPNTMTVLVEACRVLEGDAKTKLGRNKEAPGSKEKSRLQSWKPVVSESADEKKVMKKSVAPSQMSTSNDNNEFTVVTYSLFGEQYPYRTRLSGKSITLRQFKSLITKKGNYRFFFRTASDDVDTKVVNEEICDDNQVLPLFDGKIIAQVDLIEET